MKPWECNSPSDFMKDSNPVLRVLAIIGMVIGGIALAAGFALLFAIVVKALWNWLMPSIFNLRAITFWEAFGLTLLGRLLLGGFGGKGSGSKKNSRSSGHPKHRSPEEWRLYREFWDKEGREAYEKYREHCRQEQPPEESQE